MEPEPQPRMPRRRPAALPLYVIGFVILALALIAWPAYHKVMQIEWLRGQASLSSCVAPGGGAGPDWLAEILDRDPAP